MSTLEHISGNLYRCDLEITDLSQISMRAKFKDNHNDIPIDYIILSLDGQVWT